MTRHLNLDPPVSQLATAESRTYRFPLPPHPIAAEQARIMTRLALAEWHMDTLTDDALIRTAPS
jgi:hypothetical protein